MTEEEGTMEKLPDDCIDSLFILAIVWSYGMIINVDFHPKFNQIVWSSVDQNQSQLNFNQNTIDMIKNYSVYEITFDLQEKTWKKWMSDKFLNYL